MEAEMGCAGPYSELQEGFIDTDVFKEDFQDSKHPTVYCRLINAYIRKSLCNSYSHKFQNKLTKQHF